MSKIEATTPEAALKAVRRAIGYAAQGALPSQIVVQRVLTQLDRTVPAGELQKSRELLNEMMAKNVLPTEKAAYQAYEETQAALNKLRHGVGMAENESEDESEQQRPG